MQEYSFDHLKTSDIAEGILHLEGSPYSLDNYTLFKKPINSTASHVVFRTGRQVSKTVTIASLLTSRACVTPHLKAIYTNVTSAQSTSFSNSKLAPFLLYSPVVYGVLMKGHHVTNNVFNKLFSNGASARITYFADSADRIRGESASDIYFDEVQDVLISAIRECEECASAQESPRFMYAGTSKSIITTLESLWEYSTQEEWIIYCDACGKWNIPDKDNIGLTGVVCKKCDKPLNVRNGQWESFGGNKNTMYEGYHIPQIALPLHAENPKKWKALLHKREQYSDTQFDNEVMGLPSGIGERLITEPLLRAASVPTLVMQNKRTLPEWQSGELAIAGIDWGGGGMDGVSNTVLKIFKVLPERDETILMFGKKFGGGEPSKHVDEIAHYLRIFDVEACYGDKGGGNFAASQLRLQLAKTRYVPVQYTEQSAPFRWDNKAGCFNVNRTIMIDATVSGLKNGKIRCVRWEDFKPFAMEFLNVHEEIIGEASGKPRRAWRHYHAKSDDALHAMVFGYFAARVIMGKLDFNHS